MPDREQHGTITDNPILLALLNAGNRLRYGQGGESERVEKFNRLDYPGIEDVAYQTVPQTVNAPAGSGQQFIEGTRKVFDPAAAERYGSAYSFGNRFNVPEELQPILHTISSGSRARMAENPILSALFNVKTERPELVRAEEIGMQRGSAAAGDNPIYRELMAMFGG